MGDWTLDTPSWLPIVMPRPELFSERAYWPDLAPIETPHILELKRTGNQNMEVDAVRRLISLDPPRCTPTPFKWREESWKAIDSRVRHRMLLNIFTSLPIFTEVYLFGHGLKNNGWDLAYRMGDTHLSIPGQHDFLGIVAPSFITWSTRGLMWEPLYRTDRMEWRDYLPKPDFSAWPDGVPAQIIVPYERPHASGHERMKIRAQFEDDLRFLSFANGWGAPLKPVWIDMPKTMEEVIK